ncbi:MAG: peptidoglycan-associated lipoprotein Pal [Betaproteobacteria bacterium]|nr:MAG: peptidoglycan-associated lipoprotein Pal [Betaproteobacteria bacterium]
MRAIWTALTFVTLAACSSTPTQEQSPASVEDRQPSATQPGAQTQPVQRPPVAGVDLTTGKTPARTALTDPASILSKRSIFYDFDRYDIKDEYKGLVEAHARYLRDNRTARMLIQGNTDERGGREYNLALGQRRSEGVKRMLMLLGATEAQVEAVSLGEEKPKAAGSNEAAWAQNRRSDMLYGGEY